MFTRVVSCLYYRMGITTEKGAEVVACKGQLISARVKENEKEHRRDDLAECSRVKENRSLFRFFESTRQKGRMRDE